MLKIFRITNLLLIAACFIVLICHVEVSEGRLLVIPQKTSKNLNDNTLDNRNGNNCKVNFKLFEKRWNFVKLKNHFVLYVFL